MYISTTLLNKLGYAPIPGGSKPLSSGRSNI